MAKVVMLLTTDPSNISDGSAALIAKSEEELQNLTNLLEKILDCAAHKLKDGLYMIVDRH
ncbi:capping complex subunit for YIEGIA [Cohnella sp. 56]|uniref:capping complex subunit for YIEGIA n=1 Tax=Cohnella sp. 56 TaxID=3113722 RepID=UPI0030EA7813